MFDRGHEAAGFEDTEKAGSELAKANTIAAEGITPLRSSVEAGVHSLLGAFVIHSHSDYTNFACCAAQMQTILEDVLKDVDFSWGMVSYIDPGARLSLCAHARQRQHAQASIPHRRRSEVELGGFV